MANRIIRSTKPMAEFGGPQLEKVWTRLYPKGQTRVGRDSKMLAAHMRNDAQDAIDVIYAMLCYRNTAGPFDVPNFIKWSHRLRDDFDHIPSSHKAVEVAAYTRNEPVPIEVWIYLEMEQEGVVGYQHDEYDRAREITDEYLTAVLA